MNKIRKDALTNNSLYGTPVEVLTQEEFDLGYHYCYDWDELFIGPDDKEFECCSCHPLKQKQKRKSWKDKWKSLSNRIQIWWFFLR